MLTSPFAFAQSDSSGARLQYGSKGFEMESQDGRFSLQLQSRFQFRYATPNDQDPLNLNDYTAPNTHLFKINRARFKVGGHAYKSWLKYYWEYDIAQGNLLDFRLMLEAWEFLNFKVGQWKVYYSRERVISSGKQQMVDRSILNRPFTLDRQQGISIYGRLFKATPADFTYHLNLLTGTGRGARFNNDENLMYSARLQWNVWGRELAMTASDLDFHEKLTASLAIAAAANTSPFTRYSTAGGGQLQNFERETSYQSRQWLLESAFMFRGLSWQQEYHNKEITTLDSNNTTRMRGNLLQAGYFFHHLYYAIPAELELALRYAYYKPDLEKGGNLQQEYGLVVNWFFNGHANKLSAEFSFFDLQEDRVELAEGSRFRLQWDISF